MTRIITWNLYVAQLKTNCIVYTKELMFINYALSYY